MVNFIGSEWQQCTNKSILPMMYDIKRGNSVHTTAEVIAITSVDLIGS